MKITEKQIRKIIREELLNEINPYKETDYYMQSEEILKPLDQLCLDIYNEFYSIPGDIVSFNDLYRIIDENRSKLESLISGWLTGPFGDNYSPEDVDSFIETISNGMEEYSQDEYPYDFAPGEFIKMIIEEWEKKI